MSNKLKIKVCGITSNVQAKELVEMKVDFFGQIHHIKSPRHNSIPILNHANRSVLVTVNENETSLEKLASKFNTKHLQLHGTESSELCKSLQMKNYIIIKAFSIDQNFDFSLCSKYLNSTDYFLFDTKGEKSGGNGIKFNWQKLKEYKLSKPFFLSGGIGLEDHSEINNIVHPQFIGIDINSQFETSPGIKDFQKIKEFIHLIRLQS